MDVRCSTGTVRDSSSRSCVDPNKYSAENCKEYCGPSGGAITTNFGMCSCKNYVTFEEQCDKACIDKLPTSEISRQNDGTLQLVFIDPITKSKVIEKFYDELGLPDYDRTSHKCQLIDMKVDGMFGFQAKNLSQVSQFTKKGSTRKRRAVTTEPVEIRSPLICIKIGEAVVFKINLNLVNRSLSNYPQYNKNHLFNTNPDFDYGNFRQLHTIMQTTNQSITTFVHRFTEAGVHVFYDNAAPARETIVMVPKTGSACPDTIAMNAPLKTKLTLNNISKGQVSLQSYLLIQPRNGLKKLGSSSKSRHIGFLYYHFMMFNTDLNDNFHS